MKFLYKTFISLFFAMICNLFYSLRYISGNVFPGTRFTSWIDYDRLSVNNCSFLLGILSYSLIT